MIWLIYLVALLAFVFVVIIFTMIGVAIYRSRQRPDDPRGP